MRILAKAAVQELFEPRGNAIRKPLPRGGALQDAGDRVRDGLALKDSVTGERFVETAPERPDVGALVDRFAACLLGAHVGDGPEDDTGGGGGVGNGKGLLWLTRELGLESLGEAEIQDFDLPFRSDLGVGGLQVAVDDALLMSGLEAFGHLFEERKASATGMGPRWIRSASVSPGTSSSTRNCDSPLCSSP